MKDRFSPSLSYEFAWQYVQLFNALPWEPHLASRTPINLADLYGIIAAYLRNQADLRYRKIDFHQFLYARIHRIRAQRDTASACEPRAGLHEFRIIQMNGLWLTFPADLNSGWQSIAYKTLLVRNTLFHGYVIERDEAIRLHQYMLTQKS